jgi:uncharacterized membrane protein YoaK (UPF0700 family)
VVKAVSYEGWLATLLSFNAGYIDTAGFLALHSLFTAHVTGNFVTLAAALVSGTNGIIAKVLALPIFCAVIIITRLFAHWLRQRELPILRIMLSLKFTLLLVASYLALHYGPFPDADSEAAVFTGLILVSAMAIQNAAHRVHLGQMPPSTLMTGTTTQMMLDLADLAQGLDREVKMQVEGRLRRMGTSVVGFASGCAVAAVIFGLANVSCFIFPPVLGLLMLLFNVA